MGANRTGRIELETREIDAKRAQAIVNMFQANNDRESLLHLNELAHRSGYPTIEAAMKSTDFRQRVNDLYQSRLLNSEKEAFSGMYKTEYGKSVAPYVNSASGAVGAATGAIRALKTPRAFVPKGKK